MPTDAPLGPAGMHPALRLLVMLMIDVVAPIAIYYWLRSTGVSEQNALLAGSIPIVLSLAITLVRKRELDRLGVFVLVMLLLTVVASLASDSSRLLLLRDGVLTGAAGIAFLLTVKGRRPLALSFSRPLLEPRFPGGSGGWDHLWDTDPDFRRIWRVSTAIWGVGLLLDSGVRVLLAYTLPVDVVPALNGIQYGVFTILMILIVNLQQARSGLWWILAGRPGE